ncbi:hypothetical protein LCGC14_2946180 [marine sediment metagenome]|uniref:Uncharacterized protein n=1 Tax=marine sediment metagenome TaxID=412755 RepID=A0A0F8ZPA7_9ZZZZ
MKKPQLSLPDSVHVVCDQWGHCVFCGNYEDLRYGVCFPCSGTVPGDKQKEQVEKWGKQRTV